MILIHLCLPQLLSSCGSGANPISPDSHSIWPRRTVSPTFEAECYACIWLSEDLSTEQTPCVWTLQVATDESCRLWKMHPNSLKNSTCSAMSTPAKMRNTWNVGAAGRALTLALPGMVCKYSTTTPENWRTLDDAWVGFPQPIHDLMEVLK